MDEGHLLKAATELAKEINKAVDEHLPQKLAGIVKLHAGLAVGTAFIPIPGADIAAAAANTWAMYVRINKELQLPFGENATKSLAAGVMTNIASNAAGFMVVASAAKFLPVLGTLGGAAVMAATVYGLTIAAGIVYMKAIAKLLRAKSAHQVTEADLKDAADEVLKDKAAIRSIVKDARKGYEKEGGAEQHAQGTRSPSESSVQPDLVPISQASASHESLGQPLATSGAAFLATGGKTYGPFPLDEIQRMRASGKLASDTQYWKEGMAGWVPITSLPPGVGP
ncbi:MAG: hypothetical protein QOH06_2993 [Acidobacteriota bacterium]|jgi:uncharacterized protein (DUF697 family)|nr:hypothetical protein [Acidobacteriota bacterium]